MTIPNGRLTDAQLIVKARFMITQREELLARISSLSEIKKTLNQRALNARERKENYRFSQECTIIDHELFVARAILDTTKHETMFVIAELTRRALCKPGDHFLYLEVYEHGS